jgi:hypothetical protein
VGGPVLTFTVTNFDNDQGFRPGYEADKATNSAGESLIEELATPQFVKNKSISRGELNKKMSDQKQKWLDIINDPSVHPKRKKLAQQRLDRVT